MASRLSDYTRMNPPTFFRFKVNEYPQDFLDEVYQILYAMAVSSNEKDDLAIYKLKDVVKTWANKDGVSNPKPQGGKVGGLSNESPNCAKCSKRNLGKCLMGLTNCFGCGKSVQMVNDCPIDKTQEREGNEAESSGLNSDAPRKNLFYALKSRDDQVDSPDVVTAMCQVFSSNVDA
ncbi:uncharacterized protein LOC107022276 [Solanum pennellii]|uniref:Uncharacterized protein LOC107022276 n=1 Tax=Solanum pennellii TaxID=28526 RepID=A0ABM1H007_SOLPN|nr:uncharacterized protein LOC107022276 [Solanum pennellii]